MSGVWLSSAPEEHACRLPILWPFRVRIGDRWKCRCGQVWRVVADMDGRMWTHDKPAPKEGKGLTVFRPVTDEQLDYWLCEELGAAAKTKVAADVVAIIRKHFEIGSRV